MQKTRTLRFAIFFLLSVTSPAIWSNGFYVGVGGGPEAVDFNQNAVINTPASKINDNSHLSGTGVFGSLFGGYSWIHQSFYLAGEGSVDLSNVKHQRSNDEFTHKTFSTLYYRMPRAFGLNLLPGYLFTPATLFYARIGYALGYLKVSSSDISVASFNKYLSGISFGLGVNQSLSQHVAVRLEYQQVNYQSASATSFDPVGGVTKTTNIAPTTGQVEFALMYHFG